LKKEYIFVFLCLIVSLFLAGCHFAGTVIPENEWDFQGVVSSLDTPQKLVNYMSENFWIYTDPPEDYEPFLPEDFFYMSIGNCEDFAAFSSYVLDQHGYDVFSLSYMAISDKSKEIYEHTISVFKIADKKLNYITNLEAIDEEALFELLGPFNTIEEIISNEEKRIKRNVFLFGFTYLESVSEQVEPKSFEEAVNQLDTSSKILSYITRNFLYKEDREITALSPQQLFQTRKGDKFDFAVFISYLMDHHGYKAKLLSLECTESESLNGNDIIVLYYDTDEKLRFIAHHGKQFMGVFQTYDSLDDLIRDLEYVQSIITNSEVKFSRYGFLRAGTTNLMPTEWIPFF